jgi:RNA polymerase sigma-70 factor (ECF subfamily)
LILWSLPVPATDPERKGTDAELLKRLQLGDNAAWTEVTRVYGPRLYAYLRNSLPTAADTEDVLGETMAAAVRAIRSFDGASALSTFLYSIAYRKAADFWRRSTPTTSLDDQESPAFEPVAKGTDMQERVQFMEVLDSLPEASRQVLLLRYDVGLGVDEIAKVIDRSYKGTESLLSRARMQLRDALAESVDRGAIAG